MVNYNINVNIIKEVCRDIISNIISMEQIPILIDYEKNLDNGVKVTISLDDNVLTIRLVHKLKKPLIKQFKIYSISDLLKVYGFDYYNDKYLIKLGVEDYFKNIESNIKSNYLYNIPNDMIYDFLIYADFNDNVELLDSCYLYLMKCGELSIYTKLYMLNKMNYYGYDKEDIIDSFIDSKSITNPDIYFKELISMCMKCLYSTLTNEFNSKDKRTYVRCLYDTYFNLINTEVA